MSTFVPIAVELGLLEKYGIIRSTPSWTEVQAAGANLRRLAENATPYDQMDRDREAVIRYAGTLQRSLESILHALTLGTHLSSSTKAATPAEKMEDGFRALSEGLDLASLDETNTQSELNRCMRELDFNLHAEVAAGLNVAKGDPKLWRILLDSTLEKVRLAEFPAADESAAWDSWRTRLLAYGSTRPGLPVGPDINYLRCRAAGLPAGTVLKGRLQNTTPRDWSIAYIAAMSDGPGSASPYPLWFPYGILAALGFGASPELVIDAPGDAVAREFLRNAGGLSPRRGLIVIRSPSNSVTDTWRDAKSVPTLIFTAAEYEQCKRFDHRPYFERRLYGILVEVAANEKVDDILKGRAYKEIERKLPAASRGVLLTAPLDSASDLPKDWGVAVNPRGAETACLQAFPTAPTAA